MLVRGSLTIKKRLQLLNPGGLQPAEGLIALSDAQGNVRWDNLRIPTLNISSTYAVAGSLVLHLNNVYFSLIPGAEGEHISIPTTWKNLSSGSFDASVFSQDQIDALNLATEPSAGNPYATRNDLQIISLKGTDTSANILLKSPSISNMIWVSSTDGLDSYNNIVVSGDGMVSDGDGWLGVGPIRGPRAFDDAPSNGKVYGRKDAAWAEVPPTATAVSQLSNDSGFITADAIPTGLVFIAGTQIITGQKTFSEDIIVGSTASQVYTQISTNSIDVHTGDDTVYGATRLSAYGLMKFLGTLNTALNFVNPTANTTIQIPAKATPGVYTLATLEDIPVAYLPPFDKANDSYFPRGRDETQYGPIGDYVYDFSDANKGAFGDAFGQVGQLGVHPTEQYGALRTSSYAYGWNVSAEGYADTVMGMYNHSTSSSAYSIISGRNNFNASYNSFINGTFNNVPYTYLGHKTVFGNGNVVNGSVGLTSGVALLNKSFGTTVIGQANADYTNTEQGVNIETAPLFIVGNGNVNVPSGKWSASTRSNALELLKNGLMTLPSVTNALILAGSVKSLVTREYLESIVSAYVPGNLQRTVTTSFTLSNADNGYVIVVDNGATPVIITVPAGLMAKMEVGFLQLGTGDVSFVAASTVIKFPAMLGLKIKGQNYNSFLMQIAASNGTATNNYNFLGDIKA